MIMNKRIVLLVVLLLLGQCMWAQSTRVKGKVTDAKTGEVLPLVNVFFTGTTIGMTTDFDGEYYLETREEVTELQASFVGYLPKTVKINKGAYNAVDFQLEPQTFDLDEVKVIPGENPAHAILRNVSKNKYRNNPARFEQYYCKTYTKMELDLTNIKPGFKNKKLQKNFGLSSSTWILPGHYGKGLSACDDFRSFCRLLLPEVTVLIPGDCECQPDFRY